MFEGLWFSHLPALIRRISKCRGVVFALHRVLPGEPADFSPNASLQVTPEYLEFAIRRVRELGLEIVDLGEALRRVESDAPEKPFAVFTFDGGYRDNLRHALPILRRNQCPFTLYVPTAFADGVGEVWWQALEDIIAAQDAVAVSYAGETDYLPTATLTEKEETFAELNRRMRSMPEAERVELMRALAAQYGFDLASHCRELIMDWAELRIFAHDQLCTLGSKTVHHYELSKLAPSDARNEIEQSARVIKAQFGTAPIHLSFPIGSPDACGPREFELAKELGFRSAVTSSPGGLYARHRDSMFALPRVALDGRLQMRRYVDVFATGAVFGRLPGG